MTIHFPNKILLFSLVLVLLGCSFSALDEGVGSFSGQRAYQDVISQVEMGARHPGTVGHTQILNYIEQELENAGWRVEKQRAEIKGKRIINLIAIRENDPDYVLLGAHYDSRIFADQDPEESLRDQPVPGANDGGSGVAVMLELARTLPGELPIPVRLVFFDAEDNGGIEDWEWILGSSAYVRDVEPLPRAVVILDMIGDADLQVYYERNSDQMIREEIWRIGAELGYGDIFIQEEKHSMLDDHTPFIQAGIPAVDVIDFDYPYWHTTKDTVDKVSPHSLQVIGDTITVWLLGINIE
jgi:Zn-dependent M28 family amino/carboxypeptidase